MQRNGMILQSEVGLAGGRRCPYSESFDHPMCPLLTYLTASFFRTPLPWARNPRRREAPCTSTWLPVRRRLRSRQPRPNGRLGAVVTRVADDCTLGMQPSSCSVGIGLLYINCRMFAFDITICFFDVVGMLMIGRQGVNHLGRTLDDHDRFNRQKRRRHVFCSSNAQTNTLQTLSHSTIHSTVHRAAELW